MIYGWNLVIVNYNLNCGNCYSGVFTMLVYGIIKIYLICGKQIINILTCCSNMK